MFEIFEKSNVEKEKLIGGNEYLSSRLDLKLKVEDITKWTDCKKIETLSNLINAIKKKNLSNTDLTMVVKLPISISFENRILKLINEPKKVLYRYINTGMKKIDSITFQNFQKLFIENDMTQRSKNNEFIYTIRTPTGRDQIEQITTKNFNQNAYLDKIDRENTFWLLQGGKVYRSVNWIYCYYTSFDHSLNLDDKIPYYFEQIRKKGFKQEKCKERKLVYTTHEQFKTLTPKEKKDCGSGRKR